MEGRLISMAKRSWKNRQWVSTLEAGKLLGVCHMTIIRRFDAGDLTGYRVPGSRFRRIPKKNLVEFAERHGMPVPDFALPGEEATQSAPTAANSRLALIVEDDKSMANLMKRVLVNDGWEVRLARNGFDAGFLASSLLPRLILLDIMLPGIDGREACRQMRQDPRLAGTRIMAVTALRDEKSRSEIIAAGVDAYMPKPFTIRQLREAIADLTAAKKPLEPAGSILKNSSRATD
jgi:two-component system, OmpR family, response regulator RpaA